MVQHLYAAKVSSFTANTYDAPISEELRSRIHLASFDKIEVQVLGKKVCRHGLFPSSSDGRAQVESQKRSLSSINLANNQN